MLRLLPGYIFVLLICNSLFATTYKVQIQCSVFGPIYQGTLDFELDTQKWPVESACQSNDPTSSSPSYYMSERTEADLQLTVEGISYSLLPAAGYDRVWYGMYKDAQCTVLQDGSWGQWVSFNVTNPNTGKTAVLKFQFTSSAPKYDTVFQFDDCSGKVQ